MARLLCTVLLFMAAAGARAASGIPQDHMTCGAPNQVGIFTQVTCYVSSPPYVPDTAIAPYPVSFVYPTYPTEKLQLRVLLSRYNGRPLAHCTNANHADVRYMTIKPCAGHFPTHAAHVGPGEILPYGWWGYFFGDSNAWRAGLSITQGWLAFGVPIALDRGVRIEGGSYGGTGAIHLPMLLRAVDPWWAVRITEVNAQVPTTHSVRDLYPADAGVQAAWAGSPLDQIDIEQSFARGDWDFTYLRWNGSPNDPSVRTSLDIIDLCEQHQVPCTGTYHAGTDHGTGEPGVDLPYEQHTFSAKQYILTSRGSVAFTEFSENYRGARGHHNIGLWYEMNTYKSQAGFTSIKIGYRAHKNIGGGVPDQADSATTSVTLRPRGSRDKFRPQVGDVLRWTYNGASGETTVTEPGVITARGLPLVSGESHALRFEPLPVLNVPIVFTWQPRHTTPIKAAGPGQSDIDDAANWQHTPDIGRMWTQSESDVRYRDKYGRLHVVHDCTGNDAVDCAAYEARVSPDGRRIAYIVATSTGPRIPVKAQNGPPTDLWDFTTATSAVWIYDTVTGARWPATAGHRDRTPEWAADDVLVFVTDRWRTFAPMSTLGRNFYREPALQLARARLDGRQLVDVVNLSPEAWLTLSPVVLTNGDVCVSVWEGIAPREFGSTPVNNWWGSCRDINGRNIYVIIGAHGSPTIHTRSLISDWLTAEWQYQGEGTTKFRGLRGMVELAPGYMSATNYYRSNSIGMFGLIWGWLTDFGKSEGALRAAGVTYANKFSSQHTAGSGHYVPPTLRAITPWALDQDGNPKKHRDGRVTGRAGYSAPWPGRWDEIVQEWLYSHCRGYCYEWAPPGMATRAAMGGEPTAKREIRLARVLHHDNPFDDNSECIEGCGDHEHAWDARAVVPYADLYDGLKAPAIAPIEPLRTTGDCPVRVVDARAAELAPIPGMADEKNRIAFQGNADPLYPAKVTGFAVDLYEQWRTVPTREGMGRILKTIEAPLQADGSVTMLVPCGVPFLHRGIDKDKNTIASGLSGLVALGPVECHGCHDGHSTERAAVLDPFDVRYPKTHAWRVENGLPIDDE